MKCKSEIFYMQSGYVFIVKCSNDREVAFILIEHFFITAFLFSHFPLYHYLQYLFPKTLKRHLNENYPNKQGKYL